LFELKDHLRIPLSQTEDDEDLNGMIVAAGTYAESYMSRALLTQQWDIFLDSFPAPAFQLPLGQLQSVDEFDYTDETETVTAVAATVFGVDTNSDPGVVFLKPDQQWPTATLWPRRAVRLRITAGYTSIPEDIRRAMKTLIGDWYENREDQAVAVGSIGAITLPRSSETIFDRYRLRTF
jgi:uncharacterized phiE125 gp8 family phage protein